jgi:hypothetical protein
MQVALPRCEDGDEVRKRVDQRGVQYGPAFTGLAAVHTGESEAGTQASERGHAHRAGHPVRALQPALYRGRHRSDRNGSCSSATSGQAKPTRRCQVACAGASFSLSSPAKPQTVPMVVRSVTLVRIPVSVSMRVRSSRAPQRV